MDLVPLLGEPDVRAAALAALVLLTAHAPAGAMTAPAAAVLLQADDEAAHVLLPKAAWGFAGGPQMPPPTITPAQWDSCVRWARVADTVPFVLAHKSLRLNNDALAHHLLVRCRPAELGRLQPDGVRAAEAVLAIMSDRSAITPQALDIIHHGVLAGLAPGVDVTALMGVMHVGMKQGWANALPNIVGMCAVPTATGSTHAWTELLDRSLQLALSSSLGVPIYTAVCQRMLGHREEVDLHAVRGLLTAIGSASPKPNDPDRGPDVFGRCWNSLPPFKRAGLVQRCLVDTKAQHMVLRFVQFFQRMPDALQEDTHLAFEPVAAEDAVWMAARDRSVLHNAVLDSGRSGNARKM